MFLYHRKSEIVIYYSKLELEVVALVLFEKEILIVKL